MADLRQQAVTEEHWRHGAVIPSQQVPVADCGAVKPLNGSRQRITRLVRAIEVEIVPRLVLARRAALECSSAPTIEVRVPDAQDVMEFASLVLTHDGPAVCAYVEAMHAQGAALESIYLDLLAPAARRLGDLWDTDLIDFTQVWLGLYRLQMLMRALSPVFQSCVGHRPHCPRALLMSAQGEQHTFGLYMIAEFFRRAGWDVWDGPPASSSEMVAIVRSHWFAVVGISASCESRLERVASDIRAIRRASRNRAIGVMVGGPIFIEHPEYVALVGADATAVNARHAILQAHDLITLLAKTCIERRRQARSGAGVAQSTVLIS